MGSRGISILLVYVFLSVSCLAQEQAPADPGKKLTTEDVEKALVDQGLVTQEWAHLVATAWQNDPSDPAEKIEALKILKEWNDKQNPETIKGWGIDLSNILQGVPGHPKEAAQAFVKAFESGKDEEKGLGLDERGAKEFATQVVAQPEPAKKLDSILSENDALLENYSTVGGYQESLRELGQKNGISIPRPVKSRANETTAAKNAYWAKRKEKQPDIERQYPTATDASKAYFVEKALRGRRVTDLKQKIRDSSLQAVAEEYGRTELGYDKFASQDFAKKFQGQRKPEEAFAAFVAARDYGLDAFQGLNLTRQLSTDFAWQLLKHADPLVDLEKHQENFINKFLIAKTDHARKMALIDVDFNSHMVDGATYKFLKHSPKWMNSEAMQVADDDAGEAVKEGPKHKSRVPGILAVGGLTAAGAGALAFRKQIAAACVVYLPALARKKAEEPIHLKAPEGRADMVLEDPSPPKSKEPQKMDPQTEEVVRRLETAEAPAQPKPPKLNPEPLPVVNFDLDAPTEPAKPKKEKDPELDPRAQDAVSTFENLFGDPEKPKSDSDGPEAKP